MKNGEQVNAVDFFEQKLEHIKPRLNEDELLHVQALINYARNLADDSFPHHNPIGKEELINKAYLFAKKKHGNQLDDEGKNYFTFHVYRVYRCLETLVPGEYELLCAALLHDTLEDTETTYAELVKEFGKDIAELVNEVTHEGKPDEKGFFFPRLNSKRGIMLKFADRLSNLSRMNSWNIKRAEQYLRKSKFWRSE